MISPVGAEVHLGQTAKIGQNKSANLFKQNKLKNKYTK